MGCDSIVTLKLFVKPTKTYNRGNVNLCQDSTYLFNNRYIGTSGTHIDTLETYLGCDSIVRVSITLRPNLNTTENRSICEGGYYVWTYSGYQRNQAGTLSPITQRDTLRQSGTYTKSNLLSNYGCGNSATINLVVNPTYNDTIYDTICYRPTYSGHGFYISNIQNTQHTETRTNSRQSVLGCDSIVTLKLFVNPIDTSYISESIIEGQYYDFYGQHLSQTGQYYHTLQSSHNCDSVICLNLFVHLHSVTQIRGEICYGERYIQNGFNESEAGVYYDTLQAVTGADSIVVLTLIVHPTYNDTVNVEICEGEYFNEYGFHENTPGIYTHSGHSQYGCDSIFSINLRVNPVYDYVIHDTICYQPTYSGHGFSIENIRNTLHTETKIDSMQTTKGCDSIVTLKLLVNPIHNDTVNVEICEGEYFNEYGFHENTPGIYTHSEQNQYGCDSIFSINLRVNPVYDYVIHDTICYQPTYSGYGFYIDDIQNIQHSETRTNSRQSVSGCDSIVTLELFVNPIDTSYISESIIEGQYYDFYGQHLSQTGRYYNTLQSSHNCDSVICLDLIVYMNARTEFYDTICSNERYTDNGFDTNRTGVYYQNLRTIHNADSVVVLHLMVHPTYNDTVNVEICEGEYFNEYGFHENTPGIYTHSGHSQYGCDSIFSINLRVNPIYDITIHEQICEGSQYIGYGFEETQTGLYTHIEQSVHNCDSIFKLDLLVNPIYDTLIVDSICIGATYNQNGFLEQETGIYSQHLYSYKGCDSIVGLNLKVVHFIDTIYAEICQGERYELNNFNENESGIYIDSLQSMWGCDSIVVLNLTVHPTYNDTIFAETCDNIPYTQNGFNADTTGCYTQYLQSIHGCDSIVTLNLTVYPTYIYPLNKEICEGEVYIDHGFWLTYPGTFLISSYTSCHGCDSLFVLNLTVNSTYDQLIVVNICEGDTFRYEGYDNLVAWESGMYRDVIESSKGCDSAKTVMLTVNPTYIDTIFASICDNEGAYSENGFNETATGIYSQTLTSVMGCDSVVVLDLMVRETYTNIISAEICEGEQYSFGDNQLSASGIYTHQFQTIYGCDSIVELHLFVYPKYQENLQKWICNNSNYVDENFNESEEGTYSVQYTTINGCDSIITLNLFISDYSDTIEAVICEGGTYTQYGFEESNAGNFIHTSQDIYGCDSTIVLQLEVAPLYSDTIFAEIKAGETFTEYGFAESERGIYVQELYSEYGCDSTIVLSLDVDEDLQLFIPNAFTPEDRYNNKFYIVPENETIVLEEFAIFNRNGTIVFKTSDFNQAWDGKYKNEYVPQGVYKYIVVYHSIYSPDQQQRRTGSIMVLY